jgi:hypothetical protein
VEPGHDLLVVSVGALGGLLPVLVQGLPAAVLLAADVMAPGCLFAVDVPALELALRLPSRRRPPSSK